MYTTLSLFPELLSFSIIAVALLRIVTGLYFLDLGLQELKKSPHATEPAPLTYLVVRVQALAKIAAGFFLVVGLYTQGAALAGVVLSLLALESSLGRSRTTGGGKVYLLLCVLSLALLFLGAGAFAVDMPL